MTGCTSPPGRFQNTGGTNASAVRRPLIRHIWSRVEVNIIQFNYARHSKRLLAIALSHLRHDCQAPPPFRVDTTVLNHKAAKNRTNMGALIILLGLAIFVIGGLFFLVAAFRESIWWGLVCLFLPIVSFFLIAHWREARKPFFLQLLVFIPLRPGVPHSLPIRFQSPFQKVFLKFPGRARPAWHPYSSRAFFRQISE